MSDDLDRGARALLSDVANGRVQAGDRISGDLAPSALHELEQLGVVRLERDGRATVNPETEWDVLDPRVVDALIASPQGPAIVSEYLEYRRVVEIAAAGLAAEHATPADLRALAAAFDEMTAAAALGEEAEDRFHRADVAFHQALIAAARNRPLEWASDRLQPALCTARRPLARPALRRDRGLPEHQRILAAVAQGDEQGARDAMTAHLDTVEAYLREYAGLLPHGSNGGACTHDR